MANVSNALADILHGILFSVGVGIQGLEVLEQADSLVLFSHGKDVAIELTLGRLDAADF
jgi:hypothetical protein